MESVKVAIVYYSSTGTNYAMARAAQEAAEAEGAEVRLRKVRELAPDVAIDRNPAWRAHIEATRDVAEASLDDLAWADVYLFGSPTRFGNMTSQMKQFIDTAGGLWMKGQLTNKVAAAFTSALNDHGGQETTLMALYNTFYHWGDIIVPPGYSGDPVYAAGGNPYGVSATAAREGGAPREEVLDAMRYMARRAVTVARWLKAGQDR